MAGVFLGRLNGWFVTFAAINSFIVTLGGLFGLPALAFVVTHEQSFVATNPALANFGSLQVGPMPVIAVGSDFKAAERDGYAECRALIRAALYWGHLDRGCVGF